VAQLRRFGKPVDCFTDPVGFLEAGGWKSQSKQLTFARAPPPGRAPMTDSFSVQERLDLMAALAESLETLDGDAFALSEAWKEELDCHLATFDGEVRAKRRMR
jgi:Putative addiction module component